MNLYKKILTTLERWDLSSSEESGLKRDLAKDIENAVKNHVDLAYVSNCKHKTIIGGDGLFECDDCGVKDH